MKNYVELIITNENTLDVNAIKNLDITPDESWMKGDLRIGTSIKETDSGYIFKSKLKIDTDFENHVNNLRMIFKEKEEAVRSLRDEHGCEIQLSLVSYCDEPPVINFDYGMIEWIFLMGASIDVDLYFLSN